MNCSVNSDMDYCGTQKEESERCNNIAEFIWSRLSVGLAPE